MKKIEVIIFSFDRAMQLSLLLNGIILYDVNKLFNVNILFSFSSPAYQRAYAKLQTEYPQFNWIEEIVFNQPKYQINFDIFDRRNLYWMLKYKHLRKNKSNFKEALVDILEKSAESRVMFLTDDSLFINNIQVSGFETEKTAFSLRHGANIAGGKYEEFQDHIEWNVYENNFFSNWGYPFSVDGHIYDRKTLLPVIRKVLFNNPNTMEGNIAHYVKEKRMFPRIAAMKNSCLVGFELNRVQSVFKNNNLGVSQEKLNHYFLSGYSLNISFDKENITNFRPEIENIVVEKGKEKRIVYERQ